MPRILIVEDDQAIRRILAKIVNSDGYTPIIARNGEEGLQLAREQLPDIILTDIFMPKKNGLDLCQDLKLCRETANIGVIVITASNEAPDLIKIFRYGADTWIKKPFQSQDILDAIKKIEAEKVMWQKQEILGNWIEFKLASTTKILKSVNLFIEHLLNHTHLEPKAIHRLGFSINEMLINSMEHGNRFSSQKKVQFSYVFFEDRLILKLQDEGGGFNLNDIPNPLDNPVEAAKKRTEEGKRPGGYGIALTKKYMDSVEYSDSGNVLLLTKFLPPK